MTCVNGWDLLTHHLLVIWLMATMLSGGDLVGSGVLCIGLVSQQESILRDFTLNSYYYTEQQIQVPATVQGLSTILGVGPHNLNL